MTKKTKAFEQIVEVALLISLVLSTMWILMSINDIEGTSRAINYAGRVRGMTQRIVKLEITGHPSDSKIEYVEEIMQELENGGEVYNLEKISDDTFRTNLCDQMKYWETLKAELMRAREVGWEQTKVIEMSEIYFGLCDETTSAIESYAEKKAENMGNAEILLIASMFGMGIIISRNSVDAARMYRRNAILNQKAYIDKTTRVRNRRFFEEYFEDLIENSRGYSFCFLDIDGLKYVNDNFGHSEGDWYIRTFVECVMSQIRKQDEIFRLGGDEFAVLLDGCSMENAAKQMETARSILEKKCENKYLGSFSYGVIYVQEGDNINMDEMVCRADKLMYEYKTKYKKQR